MVSRIKEARKDANMTQQELADAVHLSRNFIARVETSKEKPSDRTIRDIANACRVSEDWLRYGIGDKHDKKVDTSFIELAARFDLMDTDKDKEAKKLMASFMNAWQNMSEEHRQMIFDLMKLMVESYKEEN